MWAFLEHRKDGMNLDVHSSKLAWSAKTPNDIEDIWRIPGPVIMATAKHRYEWRLRAFFPLQTFASLQGQLVIEWTLT